MVYYKIIYQRAEFWYNRLDFGSPRLDIGSLGGKLFTIGNRRFIGSKQRLANWIIKSIDVNCKAESFFEVFAGTSIVSSQITSQMKRIVLNDTLLSNNIIYEAFYGKGRISQKKINNYKMQFNNMPTKQISRGWFTKNYGGKYFGVNDCAMIESIRNEIENAKQTISKKEYNILLASLIYSMDKIANTVGHFDAYIKNKSKDNLFFLIL